MTFVSAGVLDERKSINFSTVLLVLKIRFAALYYFSFIQNTNEREE